MKRAMQESVGSVLRWLAPVASRQEGEDPAALKIAAGFASFAGSEENILALVCALREGIAVRLVSAIELDSSGAPQTVLIEPRTGPMDWNDVRMALMLARDALRRYGISRPTLGQLRAVLVGGEITTPNGRVAAFRGVLRMRAEGLNWGRIAAERYRHPESTGKIAAPVRPR
jgi:hypothetical protein